MFSGAPTSKFTIVTAAAVGRVDRVNAMACAEMFFHGGNAARQGIWRSAQKSSANQIATSCPAAPRPSSAQTTPTSALPKFIRSATFQKPPSNADKSADLFNQLITRLTREVRNHHGRRRKKGLDHKAFCVGLYGACGAGKSYYVNQIVDYITQHRDKTSIHNNVVKVSSDDFYVKAEDRSPEALSRLDVNEFDADIALRTLQSLKNQTGEQELKVPKFCKANDNRVPESEWDSVHGAVDLVLYEGWRVGIDHPMYLDTNKEVDLLIAINTPLHIIREQKFESMREDAERAGRLDPDTTHPLGPYSEADTQNKWGREIAPDFNKFSPAILDRANLVLTKDANHNLIDIKEKMHIEQHRAENDFPLVVLVRL